MAWPGAAGALPALALDEGVNHVHEGG